MSSSDGADLSNVMAAVDQVETAPLVDTERPQDNVADGTSRSKKGFGLSEELVDTGEADSGFLGKFFAGKWRRARGRADGRGGFTAAWKVSESRDRILTNPLLESGLSTGGSSLGQATVDRYLSVGIG